MFTFKIWDHIKKAWPIYKTHFGLLLLLTAITAIVNAVGSEDKWFLTILSYLVGFLLTFVWIKYCLSLVDQKEYDLFARKSFPSLRQYWNILKTSILYGLIILGGAVLLVVPAFYFSGRILFATFISVEKNQGARKSISESWKMTKGHGWRLFWKSFVIAMFIVLGFIFFMVGSLITFPIGYLVMTMLYREYKKYSELNGSKDTVKENTTKETKTSLWTKIKNLFKKEN